MAGFTKLTEETLSSDKLEADVLLQRYLDLRTEWKAGSKERGSWKGVCLFACVALGIEPRALHKCSATEPHHLSR